MDWLLDKPKHMKTSYKINQIKDSTLDPQFTNNIPKGVNMDDENIQQPDENQDASQSPDADQSRQDSSDGTQSNESAKEGAIHQPSNKEVAAKHNALKKKIQRELRIVKDIQEYEDIRERGYFKEKRDTPKESIRFVDLTDQDKQFIDHKIAQLRIERYMIKTEIRTLKKEYRALTSDAIKSNRRILSKLIENARIKRISNDSVSELKKVVTKETINTYPSLRSFAQGQQDNWIELESFFSINLPSAYNKFRDKSELKERIFNRSTTYIKNLIK